MIGFKTTLFLWGELVNSALSRDDGLRTWGLRALIDPENRLACEGEVGTAPTLLFLERKEMWLLYSLNCPGVQGFFGAHVEYEHMVGSV